MMPDNHPKLEKLKTFAREHNRTLGELAYVWLLAQPQISSVISGATSVEHVQANAAAADWELTEEEIYQVNTILET